MRIKITSKKVFLFKKAKQKVIWILRLKKYLNVVSNFRQQHKETSKHLENGLVCLQYITINWPMITVKNTVDTTHLSSSNDLLHQVKLHCMNVSAHTHSLFSLLSPLTDGGVPLITQATC